MGPGGPLDPLFTLLTEDDAMLDELRALFRFNRWANLRFLEAVGDLTQEEIDRRLGGSFPSVGETLRHLFGAEWLWLSRWRGSSPTSFPGTTALNTVADVRERWHRLWREQHEYLAGLDETAVRGELSYTRMSGEPCTEPLHVQLRHVVNHASYHRGQLAMMLRMLDRVPPGTDLVSWYREDTR